MQVRTAELVAVLSLATDLATHAPFEHGLRSTAYAMRVAAALEIDADEARRVYYLSALAGAGPAGADLAELMGLSEFGRQRAGLAHRIAAVAREVDDSRSRLPLAAADALVRNRRRRDVDRRIVDLALELAPADDDAWSQMLALEPRPHRTLTAADLDTALSALGVFGALASPYFRGHSAAVSALAALVARERGLSDDQVTVVRRAGLVHDLHRAEVPTQVWERPGELGPADRARIRLAASGPQRLLDRVPELAEIGAVTAPRTAREPALILAACAAYCAMLAPRPHRPALTPSAAARSLRADALAGRFDADVVESVLTAVSRTRLQLS